MTREGTKMKAFDTLHFVADNAGLSTFEAIEKAYNMGVSEQELILDKIRAEITNIPITDTDGHNNNWYREPQAIINDALQIIDKYKAESEGEG